MLLDNLASGHHNTTTNNKTKGHKLNYLVGAPAPPPPLTPPWLAYHVTPQEGTLIPDHFHYHQFGPVVLHLSYYHCEEIPEKKVIEQPY